MTETTGRIPQRLINVLTWFGITALVVILDWWTKQWASGALELYRPEPVFAGLNMTLAHNFGAAFSFLHDQSGWQRWLLSGLAIVVSIFILVWMLRLPATDKLTGVSLALVLGGAIGNLIDRLQLGYVVDFIDVYYQESHWPAFNIADSAITVGVVLLIIDSLFFASSRTADQSAND